MSDLRSSLTGDAAAGAAANRAPNMSLLGLAAGRENATPAAGLRPPTLNDLLNAPPADVGKLLIELPNRASRLEPPGTIHNRNDLLSKLPAQDAARLELLRMELSAATGNDEVQQRQESIRAFVREKHPGFISDRGWQSLFVRTPIDKAITDSRVRRQRAASDAAAGTLPAVRSDIVAEARQLLSERAALTIKDAAKLTDFMAMLTRFDQRAAQRGLSDSAKIDLYLQLSRVLHPDTKLAIHGSQGGGVPNPYTNPARRSDQAVVARSILRNASEPTAIDQGGHNTCNVTTLECRLYTQDPARAARLVADVAINGEFKTDDGTTIRPRCLTPDSEAVQDPVPDGQRNYASQLFQITAINIHWNRRDTLPGGAWAGRGNIAYCQTPEAGEHLLNLTKNPPEIHRFRSLDSSHPWLDMHGLRDINEQITGKPTEHLGIERWIYPGDDRGVSKVMTLAGFREKLEEVKRAGAFPIILAVDGAKKPFGSGDATWFAPHVVTITDYDPSTGLVTVDNQWGKGADHTGNPGEQPKVPIADLFSSMSLLPSSGFIWDHIKRNVKDVQWSDAVTPTLSALSIKTLSWGLSGTAPLAIRGGLGYLNRQGLPYTTGLLTATQSGWGKGLLRAGTVVGAIGVAAYINDLPGAFAEGPARGFGRLTRIGVDYAGFELGRGLARGALWATGVKWAPGRIGLMLAAGAATATVMDRILGDSADIAGSYAYERVRDWIKH